MPGGKANAEFGEKTVDRFAFEIAGELRIQTRKVGKIHAAMLPGRSHGVNRRTTHAEF